MRTMVDDVVDIAGHEPVDLMRLAAEGAIAKDVLTRLLRPERRSAFLDACGEIERSMTAACGSGDPCMEDGCSAEGEACLQPLLRGEAEYRRRCGAVWAEMFRDHENRAAGWQR